MTERAMTNGDTINCTACGHIACVCAILADHQEACRFRLAATSAVGIECAHGRDVCPICDPCSCGEKTEARK
ncbi:hypothetical protein IWQ49_006257 [Labrenzia sp. EL_126]|nr:hypothetical protein [Labrenzia sp. EL_126]